jgi:hypothetical protein
MNLLQNLRGSLRRLREIFLPTCREMSRRTSDAVDGHVGFGRRCGCWLHLSMCGACRRYRAHLLSLRRWIGRFGPDDAGSHRLRPEARDRIKAAVKQEGDGCGHDH